MRWTGTMSWAASWAAAATLLCCGVAQAAEWRHTRANDEPAIGLGIICNTSAQAERYVSLVAGGQEPVPAIDTVNAEAMGPRACGIAAVAYIRGETVDTRTARNKLVQIVRINVVAGYNGSGWQRVSGLLQYAVIDGEGEAI